MNSMRWMFLAATLLLSVPACKKEKAVDQPATGASPTEGANPVADPGAAQPAEPAAAGTAPF